MFISLACEHLRCSLLIFQIVIVPFVGKPVEDGWGKRTWAGCGFSIVRICQKTYWLALQLQKEGWQRMVGMVETCGNGGREWVTHASRVGTCAIDPPKIWKKDQGERNNTDRFPHAPDRLSRREQKWRSSSTWRGKLLKHRRTHLCPVMSSSVFLGGANGEVEYGGRCTQTR